MNLRIYVNTAVVATAFLLVMAHPAAGGVSKNQTRHSILKNGPSLQIRFVENKGQIKQDNVGYYARTFGASVFVTRDGDLIYSFQKPNDGKKVRGWAIKETFVGSSVSTLQGEKSSTTKVAYFNGKDPSDWITNIATYKAISLGEIYRGIELRLKAHESNVEKVFCIKPNADLEDIKVRIQGAEAIKVNTSGGLELKTGLGVATFTKPFAFQEENGKREEVAVAYTVHGNEYGFWVGDYDKTKELIIDPLLGSTFIGGSSNDMGIEIEVDDSGNIYICGVTMSSDFPTTPGVFDPNYNGGFTDIFITKLSSTHDVIYSTFIGGSSDDYQYDDWYETYVFGMAVDPCGNVYITGETSSPDFPTTPGANDTSFNGSTDVFVTKLNSSGDALVYSTFLGDSGDDAGAGIAVNSLGNAYVTGQTDSWDFPTTPGAFDTSYNGDGDIFVVKLNPAGSDIVYSTFLGGSEWDEACNIAIDDSGNAYVLGGGGSSDFPTTEDAYDRSFNGEYDIYISKLNASGSDLLASTFLGGSGEEWGEGMSIDNSGNIFLTGDVKSADFPVTVGAYDTTLDGHCDAFISKLDPNLSGLLASTFIGGKGFDGAIGDNLSISPDGSGDIYIAGITTSTDYPTSVGAYPGHFIGGAWDGFVSKLDNNLTALLYSAFVGGSSDDAVVGSTIDSFGYVYITGTTFSPDYPTMDAYDSTHNYAGDAFVSKFDSDLSPVCGDASHSYPSGDLNRDCLVNFADFAILAAHWLEDNQP